MNNSQYIILLSDNKIREAESLYENGFYDTAYYLAGYAVEMLLKARNCVTINIDNLYDFGKREKFFNEDNILKPYKVHNFEQLFILSGIYKEYKLQLNDSEFVLYWSEVSKWKEDVRYEIGKTKKDVNTFINSVKYFSVWIKKYL